MVYRGKCTLISKWTQHLNKPPIDSTVKIVYEKNYFLKIMTVYLKVYRLKLYNLSLLQIYKCHSLHKVEPF